MLAPRFSGQIFREVNPEGKSMRAVKREEAMINGEASDLNFCVQVALQQHEAGRKFLLECPQAYGLELRERIYDRLINQEGIVYLEGFPAIDKGNLRLSNIVTNDVAILMNLPSSGLDRVPPNDQAGVWKAHLMNGVLQSVCLTNGGCLPGPGSVLAEDGADEGSEDEAADDGEADGEESTSEARPFPEEVEESLPASRRDREIRAMVDKIHVNMAHLPKERMMVMLRAAGAKAEVLEYVKNRFSCEVCDRRQRQIPRRVAAFPKTYAFNKIVGADVFYLTWQGRSIPFLNLICHGSHWQSVSMIRPLHGGPPSGGTPLAQEVAKVLGETWFKPYGAPEVVLTDGGREFAGECERLLEQYNVFQHVCDAESPWQNARAERHGALIKDRARREMEEGTGVVRSLEDLEILVNHMVICKNSWYSRGGYSPSQLVFGRGMRLPQELLSDEATDTPGRQEAAADPMELDGPGREFHRSCLIRQRARELIMTQDATERVQRALRAKRHPGQAFTAGQWVYVYRRAVQRSRWTGPGLVIMQKGHTVWVAMRARLWKCNVDQVRPATATEAMGIEVVQELLKDATGKRAGALDVEKEGPPPDDAFQAPLHEMPQQGPLTSIPEEEPAVPAGGDDGSGAGPVPPLRPDPPGPQSARMTMPRQMSAQSTQVPSEERGE